VLDVFKTFFKHSEFP